MIQITKNTEKKLVMTAKQAINFAKELLYMAEEANDHQETHQTILIDINTKLFTNTIEIHVRPDKKE